MWNGSRLDDDPVHCKDVSCAAPVLYEALDISRGNQEKSLRQLNEEFFAAARGYRDQDKSCCAGEPSTVT
jgi:hypothetical protein